MRIIEHPQMPVSNGHYSQCVEHDGILYLSGQLPIDPVTRYIPATIEAQTDLVLLNVERILTAAQSAKNKVLQVRVYIHDVKLWDTVNDRYSVFFENHKPARCIIPTGELHFGCLIEIEVKAFIS